MNPVRNGDASSKHHREGISCVYVISFALFVVKTEIKVHKKQLNLS